MATPGGVDSSFTETLDKQGMSEQDLDCQGKQILYVGDSVGHTANLKFIESSMRCQLESLRAYSSVMDQNARWPSKNFNDVVTNHLRGQKEFNVVVMSAPTVDISNLNLEKLSRSQCEERAIKSSQNMISLAEEILANNRTLEKVILMDHHARFDCIIKKRLALLANDKLIKVWACSPFKDRIHVGHHNFDSSDTTYNERYRNKNRYDGVHLYGKRGVFVYTKSVQNILRLALLPKVGEEKLRLKGGANKKTDELKIKTFVSTSEFLNLVANFHLF